MTCSQKICASHTTGPWWIVGEDEDGEGCAVIEIGSGEIGTVAYKGIIYVRAIELDELAAEDHANARLIAAAPEMLALLKRVLGSAWTGDDVRAVIAKAEGRS